MIQNKKAYDLPGVAAGYAKESHLQAPEETILHTMLPFLRTSKMLDMGVGGGRTTFHFAKWAVEYVGADYSSAMIEECIRRFPGYPENISFKVCDARSMEMFETGYFDFILFSHNGIDYVDHDDRLKILKEIRRIGKSGGYFCFSTHNLNSLANLFEWRRAVSLNPKLAVRTAKRLALRFFCNRGVSAGKVRTSPYVLINDGAHHRQLLTHYIKPLEQIAQLENDFTDIRVFSLASGAEIKDRTQLNTNEDVWLYYLCRIR